MTDRRFLRLVLITLGTPLLIVTGGTAGASSAHDSGIPASVQSKLTPEDCTPSAHFVARNFPHHPRVDNKWFPLAPGTNFVVDGTVVDGAVTHRHRIVTTVT